MDISTRIIVQVDSESSLRGTIKLIVLNKWLSHINIKFVKVTREIIIIFSIFIKQTTISNFIISFDFISDIDATFIASCICMNRLIQNIKFNGNNNDLMNKLIIDYRDSLVKNGILDITESSSIENMYNLSLFTNGIKSNMFLEPSTSCSIDEGDNRIVCFLLQKDRSPVLRLRGLNSSEVTITGELYSYSYEKQKLEELSITNEIFGCYISIAKQSIKTLKKKIILKKDNESIMFNILINTGGIIYESEKFRLRSRDIKSNNKRKRNE